MASDRAKLVEVRKLQRPRLVSQGLSRLEREGQKMRRDERLLVMTEADAVATVMVPAMSPLEKRRPLLIQSGP